jgi:YVTN family beta-propeller protein
MPMESSGVVRRVRGGLPVLMVLALSCATAALSCAAGNRVMAADMPSSVVGYRTPVDVACLVDGRLVTANAAAGTVSLVDPERGPLDEIAVGARPTAVAASATGEVVASVREAGDLVVLGIDGDRLVERGRVHLGFEPWHAALSPDGARAYVPLSACGRLAVVDVAARRVVESIEVGKLPRFVAVAPDGGTIAVACSEGAAIVLVDADSLTVRDRAPFKGLNLGELAFAPDGATIYFAWTYDGGSHPSPGNIRRGWVTGSRLGRLRLPRGEDDEGGLDGLTLDVPGRAVGDVLGVEVLADGGTVLMTAGGSHELLRLATGDLPWTQISGLEVMDPRLAADGSRFSRVEIGGRPLGMTLERRSGRVWIANGLSDTLQAVAPGGASEKWTTVATVSVAALAGPADPAAELARRGEAIFHDARRSLDQWYSCHTCHYEGGGSTITFDTRNDGSIGTYKTVLPLWGVAETGPWTWHGWQTDLTQSLEKSLVESMQGPQPSADDVTALAAYLGTLRPPPSPFRRADGGLDTAAERGRALFASARAGCTTCHGGEHLTSGETYDVGLGRSGDRYPTFSPPSLLGVFRKTRLLHHGKARSLADVLTRFHGPEKVSGTPPLDPDEVADLVAYLESL